MFKKIAAKFIDNAMATDAEVTTAITTAVANKADVSHTHADASISASGFMSASDKTKIDSLKIYKSTNNYTNNSGTSPVTITDLGYNAVSGKTYSIKYKIVYSTDGATHGIVPVVVGNLSVSLLAGNARTTPTSTGFTVAPVTALNTPIVFGNNNVPAINTKYIVEIELIAVCSASGTLAPGFAVAGGSATVTVYAGSVIELTEL